MEGLSSLACVALWCAQEGGMASAAERRFAEKLSERRGACAGLRMCHVRTEAAPLFFAEETLHQVCSSASY